jgi:hypothetical protein
VVADQHHHEQQAQTDQPDVLDAAAVVSDQHRKQREDGEPPRDWTGQRKAAVPAPVDRRFFVRVDTSRAHAVAGRVLVGRMLIGHGHGGIIAYGGGC